MSIFAAFDQLSTLIAIICTNGRCQFINTAFEAYMGLSRRSLYSSCVFDWFIESERIQTVVASILSKTVASAGLDAQLRRLLTQGEADTVHVMISQLDASSEVLIELTPIAHKTRVDRESWVVEQLQANKELVRNLAHEIKNPLGGIRGAAQLLEMEIDVPELIEYTQVIIKEADRLKLLVDRLLAPHRQVQSLTEVSIHEICEQVRALLLAEFAHGLQILPDYDISIPSFLGDREQLIQAVLNLAQNAAQALSQKIQQQQALIVLRTRIARQVTLGNSRHKLALELQIEDNGPGVDESVRDRIFYPLVSARGGGTGLGLTLAQAIVQQHRGLIEFDSHPGLTIFKVFIPLS